MPLVHSVKVALKRVLEPYPKIMKFALSAYRFGRSPWSEILQSRKQRLSARLDEKLKTYVSAIDARGHGEYKSLVGQLCKELPAYTEYSQLSFQIRLLGYCGQLLRNEAVNQLILTDVFDRIRTELSLDQRSSFLGYFVSRQDNERAEAFILEELRSPASAFENSHFVKWALNFAIRQKNFALEQKLLLGWQGGNTLHAYEVDQRKLHLTGKIQPHLHKATGKVKIFIGFFGQLRDPEVTVPDLIQFLESDLKSEFGEDQFEVRYALSTWEKEGSSELSEWHGMNRVVEKVPQHINEIFNFYDCRTAGDVIESTPHLGQLLIEVSKRGGTQVTAPKVKNLFENRKVRFQIASESPIDQKILPYQLNGVPIIPHLKNQFKMFSRLSALKEIFTEFVSEGEGSFDICLILRPDLKLEAGRLAPYVRKALESKINLIISDQDKHAELVEGVGDRYFVGRPELLLPVIDCYSDMIHAFESRGPESFLQNRLGSHEFLGSRFFTQGTYHECVNAVRYWIFRNQVPKNELKEALMKDLESRSTNREKRLLKKHIELL